MGCVVTLSASRLSLSSRVPLLCLLPAHGEGSSPRRSPPLSVSSIISFISCVSVRTSGRRASLPECSHSPLSPLSFPLGAPSPLRFVRYDVIYIFYVCVCVRALDDTASASPLAHPHRPPLSRPPLSTPSSLLTGTALHPTCSGRLRKGVGARALA